MENEQRHDLAKMSGDTVIRLTEVSKIFDLYGSHARQALATFKIGWLLGPSRCQPIGRKLALDQIERSVQRGEKVGVIGRNGSGKTTLLRLIIGQISPTRGTVETASNVQAMMQTGFGFNDDLSGYENVVNSLLYNGLSKSQRKAALEDIVSFVELGDFLSHPLKTYSLGMRARLEFATATAIHPDVLVVDEVLGAGDGYFAQKSARRMQDLIDKSTLVLVSHSMQQIMDYCDRVIWLDSGVLVEDGEAKTVIMNYEKFMAQDQAEQLKTIEESMKSLPGADGEFFANRDKSEQKIATFFEENFTFEEGPELENCTYTNAKDDLLISEVGREFSLTFDVVTPKGWIAECEPVLYGFSEEGQFLFEGEVGHLQLSGNLASSVVLENSQAGIGIGNYLLRVTLRNPETQALYSCTTDSLMLRIPPTNYSDPALVHLNGEWFSGEGHAPIEGRVNAWV